MKFYCLLGLGLMASLSLSAQQSTQTEAKDTVKTIPASIEAPYKQVDVEASFPGGDQAWNKFLGQHFSYPVKAMENEVQGTVIVQFIVAADGSLSDIHVISGPALLRQASLDVMKQSPDWTPATIKGKAVPSYQKRPFKYVLTKG